MVPDNIVGSAFAGNYLGIVFPDDGTGNARHGGTSRDESPGFRGTACGDFRVWHSSSLFFRGVRSGDWHSEGKYERIIERHE